MRREIRLLKGDNVKQKFSMIETILAIESYGVGGTLDDGRINHNSVDDIKLAQLFLEAELAVGAIKAYTKHQLRVMQYNDGALICDKEPELLELQSGG